ncbi:MAG: hypothetical protein WBP11_15110 [Dokdonella sp.]
MEYRLAASSSKPAQSSVLGLLAIESGEPGTPPRCTIDRTHAQLIASAIAADLIKLDPGVSSLDLVVAGALFDQAQILRPGWPAHAALLELQSRVIAVAARAEVLAIAAHDGAMPLPALEPDPRLFGSPLLILPWTLSGDAEQAAATASRFEQDLVERGMAGSDLALALQDAFGIGVRHVQHLTVFDLCAIGCAQYEQAGFGALWQLIENALLTPTREHTVTIDDQRWTSHGNSVSTDAAGQASAHHRAILAAHGIETIAIV